MARYDDTFVDRFLEPWNRHDVDGALALMTDDCVWEVTRGREGRPGVHRRPGSGRAPATKHEVACRRTLRSRRRPGVRRDPVSGLLRSSPVSSQRHRRPPDLDVPRHAGRTAPAALTVEPLAAPGAWAFTNGSYFGHAPHRVGREGRAPRTRRPAPAASPDSEQ
jgi:hypothetical protein